MQVYYATITAVVAISYLFLKKYLPRNKAITVSVFSFVLLGFFPKILIQFGAGNTLVIYILAAFLLPYILKLNEQQNKIDQDDKTDKAISDGELKDQSTQKVQGEDDMPNSSHVEITRSINVEPKAEPETETETEIEIEIHPENKEVEDVKREVAVGKNDEESNDTNNEKNIEQQPAQQDTYDEQLSEKENPVNNKEDIESEEEEEEEIPVHYAHTEIVRSVTEDEIELNPKEENAELEQRKEFDEESEKQEELIVNQEEKPSYEDVETTEELNEDKLVMEEPAEPNAKELIAKGLANSKEGNYSEAVKMLVDGLKQNPAAELKYLAVSEISDVYQQMGMYSMAASIIAAYIKQPELADHQGIKAWKEKLTYLNNLIKVLKQNNISNKPYSQVPNFVKKKAFSMTLEKINK